MSYGTSQVEQIFNFFVTAVQDIFSALQSCVIFEWNGIQITLMYIAVMFIILTFLLAFVQFWRGY